MLQYYQELGARVTDSGLLEGETDEVEGRRTLIRLRAARVRHGRLNRGVPRLEVRAAHRPGRGLRLGHHLARGEQAERPAHGEDRIGLIAALEELPGKLELGQPPLAEDADLGFTKLAGRHRRDELLMLGPSSVMPVLREASASGS